MKDLTIVVLVVALAVMSYLGFAWQEDAELRKEVIARMEAVAATGPCGDKFLVVANEKEFFIAGNRVNENLVNRHYQEIQDGAMIVRRQEGEKPSPNDIIVMRRRLAP